MVGLMDERIRLLVSRFANFVRLLVSWAIASILVCGCVVGFYYFQRADEELRIHAEKKFAESFPNHNVAIGSAHLVKGEGIRLRNVSIVQPATMGRKDRTELIFCDDVTLNCTPTLDQLLRGQVDVEHVRLRGLSLHPTRRRDGSWNFEVLRPDIFENNLGL